MLASERLDPVRGVAPEGKLVKDAVYFTIIGGVGASCMSGIINNLIHRCHLIIWGDTGLGADHVVQGNSRINTLLGLEEGDDALLPIDPIII